jgi:NADH dehydrogenase FAD-containing subunit
LNIFMTQVVRIVIVGGSIAGLLLATRLGDGLGTTGRASVTPIDRYPARSIDYDVPVPYLGSHANYFQRAGSDLPPPFRRQPAAGRNLQYMLYRRHRQALHGFRKATLLWTAARINSLVQPKIRMT